MRLPPIPEIAITTMNILSPVPRRIHSLNPVVQCRESVGDLYTTSITNSRIQAHVGTKKTKHEEKSFEEVYSNSLGRYLEGALNNRQDCSFKYDGLVFAIQASGESRSFSICARLLKCSSSNVSVMRNALEWNHLNHRDRRGYALALAPSASHEPLGQLEITLCCTTEPITSDENVKAQLFTAISSFVEIASGVRQQLNGHCEKITKGASNRKSSSHPMTFVGQKQIQIPPLRKKAAVHPAPQGQPSLSLSTATTTQQDEEQQFHRMDEPNAARRDRTVHSPSRHHRIVSESCQDKTDVDMTTTHTTRHKDEKKPRHFASVQTSLPLALVQPASKSLLGSKSSAAFGKASLPLDTYCPPAIDRKQSIVERSHVPRLKSSLRSIPPIPKRRDPFIIQSSKSIIKRREPFVMEVPPPLPPQTDVDKTPTISNKKMDRPPQSLIRKATKRLSIQRNYSFKPTPQRRHADKHRAAVQEHDSVKTQIGGKQAPPRIIQRFGRRFSSFKSFRRAPAIEPAPTKEIVVHSMG
jgi:hypothetical protein